MKLALDRRGGRVKLDYPETTKKKLGDSLTMSDEIQFEVTTDSPKDGFNIVKAHFQGNSIRFLILRAYIPSLFESNGEGTLKTKDTAAILTLTEGDTVVDLDDKDRDCSKVEAVLIIWKNGKNQFVTNLADSFKSDIND